MRSYTFPSSEQIIYINYMEFHMECLSFLRQSSIYWIIVYISMESNVDFFFFWMSLLSGTITLFQAHLVSSFLSPKNNYFSRMSGSFYWRMVLETYSECSMCLLLKGCQYFYTHSENKYVCIYWSLYITYL